MPERVERVLRANGVDLCVETFGDHGDPAILLIAGATGSMLSWDEELCERLAAGSRFVIRYDLRDTGRSVTYEPGSPQYTGADLVEDAVGVLDASSVDAAHLVGISMGGGIAQIAALDHPGSRRVAHADLDQPRRAGRSRPSTDVGGAPRVLRRGAGGAGLVGPKRSDRLLRRVRAPVRR